MGWKVFLPDRYIKPVENKVHEIAGSVASCLPDEGGMMGGKAGLACFCAYYADWTGDQAFNGLAADLIEKAINPAAGRFPDYRYSDGLSGVAWLIHHFSYTGLMNLDAASIFDELDQQMERWDVHKCLISTQPEPHLVQAWRKKEHHGFVRTVDLLNDGTSKPEWPKWEKRVTVDRTFLLNSAYEEIREQKWWIRPDSHLIDIGEFYAHMKAPSRVRDLTTGELRYRWTETGALDHYRFAHAFDHLDGAFRKFIGVFDLI